MKPAEKKLHEAYREFLARYVIRGHYAHLFNRLPDADRKALETELLKRVADRREPQEDVEFMERVGITLLEKEEKRAERNLQVVENS